MKDDLKILFELLEGPVHEVTGRIAAIPSEVREKIARFAAGTSSEEEREEMKKWLREKPELIPVLAAETQALRPSTE